MLPENLLRTGLPNTGRGIFSFDELMRRRREFQDWLTRREAQANRPWDYTYVANSDRSLGTKSAIAVERIKITQLDVNKLAEAPTAPVIFSADAREWLKDEGYYIHTLTGQSVKNLREAGGEFWDYFSEWYKGSELEELTSRVSEVAINPNQLFLRSSMGKTYAEQGILIDGLSQSLRPVGIEAVRGSVPDYTELAFRHLVETGNRLFGSRYLNRSASTSTDTTQMRHAGAPTAAFIEYFSERFGFYISSMRTDNVEIGGVGVAPLLVPAV